MNTFFSIPSGWLTGLVALLLAYLAFLFFMESRRHQTEVRAACWIAAIFLLPLLIVALFVYDGHLLNAFDAQLEINRNPNNWWVIKIVPQEGQPSHLNILGAAILFAVLYIGTSLLIALASRFHFRRKGTEFLSIHKALIKWTVVLVGLVMLLNINLWPLILGMGAASIVLGFALKEMLENLFTGMALDMEGAFHTGDWIRLGDGDTVGRVYEKHWRSTKILTMQDESITIPNRMLGAEKILAYGKPKGLFAWRLTVGTSYNDPPVKVKEVLRTILMRESEVAKVPPPVVRTIAYDDFSINYEMKFWIRDYGRVQQICDSIMTQVWYAFKFYGIQIPFPIRTLHHFGEATIQETESALEEDTAFKLNFLGSLDFLSRHLKYRDMDFLARNVFRRRYAPGEHIVHKGEVGDALYIVVDGFCDALLPDGQVRCLESGHYFGEMGLLGATRRTADVVAGPDGATVLRVDKHCMDVLFRAHPEMLQEFRHVRDVRTDELPVVKPDARDEAVGPLRRIGRYAARFLWPW